MAFGAFCGHPGTGVPTFVAQKIPGSFCCRGVGMDLLLCSQVLLEPILVDPPATMLNAAGDYVASFIVERFVSGKDWLQKHLAAKK